MSITCIYFLVPQWFITPLRFAQELSIPNRGMASVSMMASVVGGAAVAKPVNNSRTLVAAKSTARAEGQDVATNVDCKEEKGSSGRRAAMFAVAAAAVSAVAGSRQGMMAFADEEPKRGTLEAKKKYAPVCVAMPTARVCHKIA